MIRFLFKGLLRDRQRSLFPVLIVAGGVFITVLMYCYIGGYMGDMLSTTAKLETGHVKIMTRAYKEISSQIPNDLALSGVNQLLEEVRTNYPDMEWTARTKFGGLLDFPNEQGETKVQGTVFGLGIDLLSANSREKSRLQLEKLLVRGRLPVRQNEIVISEDFSKGLGVEVGETATLISATSKGSMAVHNFKLVGTVQFGIAMMDRKAMIADISDIQYALDMENGAGEILGFFPKDIFQPILADQIRDTFNQKYQNSHDEFTPLMLNLREQMGLGEMLDFIGAYISILLFVFIFIMSIILWNTGLMSGLRRYGEVGVRLAMGENKGHVYRTMIIESILIGIVGSAFGTLLGLGAALYLQEVGLDISEMLKGSKMLIANVIRARITTEAFFIGYIPGVLATVIGTMISGIGIFKRQTSQLFKELEI